MTEPREVYVIGLVHPESNPHLSQKESTREVLDVSFRLATEIGRQRDVTSVFIDGHDYNSVQNIQNYLRALLGDLNPVPLLLQELQSTLRENDYKGYMYMKEIELLFLLHLEGLSAKLKPTDFAFRDFREMGIQLYAQWCMKHQRNPSTVTPEEFKSAFYPTVIAFRDGYIHQNIQHFGTAANLLLVGIGHPLESLLQDASLRSWRLNVDYNDTKLLVAGSMPPSCQDSLTLVIEELRRFIPLESKLDYT